MPELNWIGKAAVVKHHKEVPFRLLETDPELSCGDPDSGNLIVEGDNLHALKALLPRYAGKVKCIYIDPPNNTGNEGWVYNGILKDRSDLGGNVLNQRTLSYLEKELPYDGPKTIYGARSRYQPARLKAAGIEFKQLPYRLQY